MRSLIYIRQSHTDNADDSLSLAFQERTCRELVTRMDGTVIEPPIIDPDLKGWDPNRPGIVTLLDRAERERPDAVVVYAASRFARDNWLQEGIWRRLKSASPEARFLSVTEPHAEDDMVRGLLGVISEAERRRMGAFLASTFRERARRGLPHGKIPFGFAKAPDGRLAIDDDAAVWVRQMVDNLEAGWSLWRVAAWLNEHHVGGRVWEPNTVRNTVTTRAIAGGVTCGDVVTWEAHAGIIDRERYERLCRMLATRRPVRRGKPVSSWLEGLMHCGCGEPMHLVTHRSYDPPRGQFRCGAQGRAKRTDNPYPPLCPVRPRTIMQHAAERETIAAIRHDLDALLSPEAVYRALRDADRAGDRETNRRQAQRTLDRARTERERLLVLYRRGTLDVERWEREDATAARAILDAELALERIGAPPDPDAIAASWQSLASVREMVDLVARDDPAELRGVLMTVEATVQRTPDGVRIVWPPDLAPLIG